MVRPVSGVVRLFPKSIYIQWYHYNQLLKIFEIVALSVNVSFPAVLSCLEGSLELLDVHRDLLRTLVITSKFSTVTKWCPLKRDFGRGNKNKSSAARSGLYGGWWSVGKLVFCEKLLHQHRPEARDREYSHQQSLGERARPCSSVVSILPFEMYNWPLVQLQRWTTPFKSEKKMSIDFVLDLLIRAFPGRGDPARRVPFTALSFSLMFVLKTLW